MTPEDLIQTIRHLTSSGMPPAKIGEVYETLKPSMNGNFTEDHHKEIIRLITSVSSKEKNIAQEVYEWIMLQWNYECYRLLHTVTIRYKTG